MNDDNINRKRKYPVLVAVNGLMNLIGNHQQQHAYAFRQKTFMGKKNQNINELKKALRKEIAFLDILILFGEKKKKSKELSNDVKIY